MRSLERREGRVLNAHLIGVHLDDADSVGLLAFMLEVLVDLLRELATHHVVDRNVNVGARLAEELVPDPAPSAPERRLETVVASCGKEGVENLLLLRLQPNGGVRVHPGAKCVLRGDEREDEGAKKEEMAHSGKVKWDLNR